MQLTIASLENSSLHAFENFCTKNNIKTRIHPVGDEPFSDVVIPDFENKIMIETGCCNSVIIFRCAFESKIWIGLTSDAFERISIL